jgi:hypothetical protein
MDDMLRASQIARPTIGASNQMQRAMRESSKAK